MTSYSLFSLKWFLLLFTLVASQEFEPKSYCTYGDSCWPSSEEFKKLQTDNPTMHLVQRGDPDWNDASKLVLNYRIAKAPGATIFATSASDIQAAIKFSQDHNLNLKTISSGHEFIGRNIAEGCLQLSVSKMDSISTDLTCPESSAGCMTVGPGVWWLQAYKAADKVGRIVLGGAEPSVSVTGWMLGGGHSPFSPKIGLGVDQVLEIQMVLADLSVVTMTKSKTTKQYINGTVTTSAETDLFWAVRGGGGNTFGVVTSIKYRLHMPPNKYTVHTCAFSAVTKPRKAMRTIKTEMHNVMKDLPDKFGGYIFSGTLCYTLPCKMAVYATYIFQHWGAVSDSQDSFDKLNSASSTLSEYLLVGPCTTTEYGTYYEYVQTLPNVTYQSLDMHGTFFSESEHEEFIKKEALLYSNAFGAKKTVSATYIRLGGQTTNTSSGATAVNPLFRNAMFTVAYGGGENWPKKYKRIVEKTASTRGQYYSECDDELPPGEWQKQFWGDNYDRLLDIKRKYDPNNDFTCKQCVGSNGNVPMSFTYILMVSLAFLKVVTQ